MFSANPALEKAFKNVGVHDSSNTMTLQGAVNKTYILLTLLLVAAVFGWNIVTPQNFTIILIGSGILGFITVLVTMFVEHLAPITAPIYALLEGVFVGAISFMYASAYSGIVFNAIALTIGILLTMLLLYTSGTIKVTQKFKVGVMAATFGIMIVYALDLFLGFLGVGIPFLHSSGIVGILVSLFIVVVASANLVLNFDFIAKGAEHGAPKHMEWVGAVGLLVTLVWLYLEVLRLLAKLNSD